MIQSYVFKKEGKAVFYLLSNQHFAKAHINISEEAFSPSRRDGGGPPVVSCDVEMTGI